MSDAMKIVSVVLWMALLFSTVMLITGCSTTARDQAITGCRQAGYLSATEDAGLWYCYKGPPLALPKPSP